MNSIRIWQLVYCIFCLYCYSSFAASNEGKLGSYNIDTTAISVSGLSSGGFMAVQMHIIESDTFMGAGVVAGGPYNCAQDSLSTALTACMSSPYMIQVKSLIENAKAQADLGRISSLDHLYNSKLYLFSGKEDSIVKPGVMTKAQEFYEEFVNPANILTQYDIVAEHGFVTMDNGGACNRIYTPTYINDCDYDSAYHLLNHIYGGNLEVPSYSLTAPAPRGTVLAFDQSEFIDTLNPSSIGMASKGYIFVPDSCAGATESCRLHVSIHGCKQGDSFIGDSYVMQTGYNEVSALNNIIVIYPQASVIPISNPNGCWDFWGYTDSNYAYHNGKQVVAIMNMVKRLTSGSTAMTSSSAPTMITTTPDVVPTDASTIKITEPKTTTKPGSSIEDGVLGSYKADKNAISVSGLSSGGYMAIQMHVAESDTIMGAGAIAGGPYYCARNSLTLATTYCMTIPMGINVETLKSDAQDYVISGAVPDLSNLNNDKVYLYSGTEDTTVLKGVVEKAEEFYLSYVNPSNIKTEYDVASQNGFPTMNKGGLCGFRNTNDINNCGFAAAYHILNHIYGGNLQMPDYESNDLPKGQLLEFSQADFVDSSNPKDIVMDETGLERLRL
uniref:uncharacterized protein LOC120344730 n=1 Tax=Styela clava TaxID=7725 RepID=UPI00193A87CD|nr:uncharacterized protein LOC120344730 [Styela clava]